MFIVSLKDRDNVKVLGTRSNGTLSYGRKSVKWRVSPSRMFQFKPTNIDYSQYLKYEDIGITPDVTFKVDENLRWQAIEYVLDDMSKN